MKENLEFETITKLREDFICACNMPTKPSFYKFDKNHIFDEEKSVRWNREEVERLNTLYDESHRVLKKARNNAIQAIVDRIIYYISISIGCSHKKAEVIWKYAYDEYHSCCYDMFEQLNDLISLFIDYEQS